MVVVSAWPAIRDGNPGPAGLRPLGTEPRRPSGDRLENRGRPQRAAVTEQVAAYALLASGDAPHLPIDVTLRWIRTRAGARHRLFDPAAIPALRTTLLARMTAIRAQLALVEQGVPVADAFPVRPSSLCAACPVAALCPAAAVYAPTALASWTAPPHPLTPDAPDPAATAVGEALLATEAATLAKAQVRSCRGR